MKNEKKRKKIHRFLFGIWNKEIMYPHEKVTNRIKITCKIASRAGSVQTKFQPLIELDEYLSSATTNVFLQVMGNSRGVLRKLPQFLQA